VFTNEETFPQVKASGADKPQAAMVIMDPNTGNVLGMVGGRGEKQGNRVLNRATQSFRQPGSSIKPLTVYSPALDMGAITPYSIFDNTPLSVSGGKPWPKNENGKYTGRMTVEQAVDGSINAVAARVVDMITPERSFTFGSVNLGLTSLVRQQEKGGKVYADVSIAPLSLGGLTKGVSVEEMTAAYCAFDNKGFYTKPRTYTRVEDSNGKVVLDNKPKSVPAMKEKTAYYMNFLLQSAVKQGTGTPAQMKNMPVAGKTGTTNDNYDRWFMGYTPYYVGGVWFGFDEPQEIITVKSTNPALALWKLVMDKVHEGLPKKEFYQPTGLVNASYCLDSGLAPSSYCRMDPRGNRVATGLFYKEDVPSKVCDIHVPVNID
jgi:penicillin-binding protein 1A